MHRTIRAILVVSLVCVALAHTADTTPTRSSSRRTGDTDIRNLRAMARLRRSGVNAKDAQPTMLLQLANTLATKARETQFDEPQGSLSKSRLQSIPMMNATMSLVTVFVSSRTSVMGSSVSLCRLAVRASHFGPVCLSSAPVDNSGGTPEAAMPNPLTAASIGAGTGVVKFPFVVDGRFNAFANVSPYNTLLNSVVIEVSNVHGVLRIIMWFLSIYIDRSCCGAVVRVSAAPDHVATISGCSFATSSVLLLDSGHRARRPSEDGRGCVPTWSHSSFGAHACSGRQQSDAVSVSVSCVRGVELSHSSESDGDSPSGYTVNSNHQDVKPTRP